MMEINQYIEENMLPGTEGTYEQFWAKWRPVTESIQDRLSKGLITQEQAENEMLKVPSRGILIKDYAKLKLDHKAGTRYYYDKLQEAKEKKEKNGSSGCPALDNILESGEDLHGTWSDFEGLGEAEMKLMHDQTEYIIKEVAEQITKARGTVPGEFKMILEKINYKEPPRFNWQQYIRQFVGGSTKTYTKKKRSKFNKRFEDMPGLKIKMQRHVLVAVDTSGSVSIKSLVDFFKEIHHISKGQTQITILQCDAAIRSITPYSKTDVDAIKIHGRGGTDFNPIIDYANNNPHKYTALIVMTDGCAPAPEKCRLKILWVHDETSEINENLIGLKIKLN